MSNKEVNATRIITGKTPEEFTGKLASFIEFFSRSALVANMVGTENGYYWQCTKSIDALMQECQKDKEGNYYVEVEVIQQPIGTYQFQDFQYLPNKRSAR